MKKKVTILSLLLALTLSSCQHNSKPSDGIEYSYLDPIRVKCITIASHITSCSEEWKGLPPLLLKSV